MNDLIKGLILYLVLSSLGWIWVIMGISTLRTAKKVREQERSRTTATVVDLIPEQKVSRSHRNHRREIRTVWHPVVEFTVDGRGYRLQNPADMHQGEISVGDTVDILYDAGDPNHFTLEKVLEHDVLAARIFIVVGIVWAVFFSPFLIHKELNG